MMACSVLLAALSILPYDGQTLGRWETAALALSLLTLQWQGILRGRPEVM